MKIAIMQPYFFPYLGYFQLIDSVDKFVFFDDVNYINKGWINRNQIILNKTAFLFTVPLKKASQNKKINEIEVAIDDAWLKGFYSKLKLTYNKAPHYREVTELIQNVIDKSIRHPNNTISNLAINSVQDVLNYLGVDKEITVSSNLDYEKTEGGANKILNICKILGATHYINPINGSHLYSQEQFGLNNLDLSFIEMNQGIKYMQIENDFIPNLSIIDVLMYNHVNDVKAMMQKYSLLKVSKKL